MVDPVADRRPPITPQLALRVAIFGGIALVLFCVRGLRGQMKWDTGSLKLAFWALMTLARAWGWPLVDCQLPNPHLLSLGATSIPVVKTDRGGQITYHGPGQLVAYLLADLKRNSLGVRSLVSLLENAAIGLLAQYGLKAMARPDAPGVYVDDAKIAALGLRIRHGCSYHGVALNVDMDLSPFAAINPCGYAGLKVIQTKDLNIPLTADEAGERLSLHLLRQLDLQNGRAHGRNDA